MYCFCATNGLLQAQSIAGHRPNTAMIRRYQQMQQQQARHSEQMHRAYVEYQREAQASLLVRQAEKKSEVARRHEKLEMERQARIQRNKQNLIDRAVNTSEQMDSETLNNSELTSRTETQSNQTELKTSKPIPNRPAAESPKSTKPPRN